MRRVLLIILAVVAGFVIISLLFAGMASQRSNFNTIGEALPNDYSGGGAPDVAPAMEAPESPAFAYDEAANQDKSVGSYVGEGQAAQERMVIQTADLAIVVTDPKERMSEISALANEMGGYVVSSNMYQSFTPQGQEVPEATIVIRVPSERLNEALAEIKQDVVEVEYENRSGQDVTNIYVDLQAQLTAKQAAEQQLLEIMDQATRTEDVLAVYMQIQAIQTEIEQLKGQIQYYEESAALSSLSVRLIAEESTQPLTVGPWKPEGAVKDAIEDLVYFLQNFVDFLIRFVIYILPALIVIAIPLALVFFGARALFRRYNRSKVVVEAKDGGKEE
jgi:hypothetical protein